jgi:hypothetical protein
MKKSICIIAFSPIAKDARVLRQIQYLVQHYDLTVIGYGPPPPAYAGFPGITWIQLDQPPQPAIPNFVTALRNRDYKNIIFWKRVNKKAKNLVNRILLMSGYLYPKAYEAWYTRQTNYREALHHTMDAVCKAYHANDWETLPIAAAAAQKNNAALILDLHEYAPLEFEDRPRWWIQKRFITYILNKYSPQVDITTTVAVPIAERYRKEFGFDPVVIMNAPESLSSLPPLEMNSSIRVIHHGIASSIRNPELMIETIARCDERYTLHFMFIHNDYVEDLKRLAEKSAPGRVFFHDPVPPGDIPKEISQYDVGFFLIPPTNYNYDVCLPNKFFDFICAGLAVCIGPSPAMAELVHKYGFGIVSDTFKPDYVAAMLNKTSSEQWSSMRQAARNALKELNAQVEMKKLIDIYSRLL